MTIGGVLAEPELPQLVSAAHGIAFGITIMALVSLSSFLLHRTGKKGPTIGRRRAAYLIESVSLAFAYYSISAYVYFVAFHENAVVATVANFVVIVIVVTFDQFEFLMLRYLRRRSQEGTSRQRWMRIAWWLTGASWKSGLYVFYIAVLGTLALEAVGADFPLINEQSQYLESVRYGLLILVAADKFADQMTTEMRRGTDHLKIDD